MRTFKKRESLTGQGLYRQWEDWSEGDVLVGKLSGFFTDKYNKLGVKVEVIDAAFKDKTQNKFIGKTLSINACGGLAKVFEGLKEDDRLGELFQFEYQGKTEVQKGKYAGSDCHVVEMNAVEGEEEGDDDL